jgi:hypothetical protein
MKIDKAINPTKTKHAIPNSSRLRAALTLAADMIPIRESNENRIRIRA